MYMFLRSTCNITCELCQIPCACVECTYMLEKLWVNGFSPQQQPRYQPVKNFPYWTGQGSFKNWNIITLSHKSITSVHLPVEGDERRYQSHSGEYYWLGPDLT